MEDPEIRNIMNDPIMKQVLTDLSTNPASAQQHMQNPEVASKIEKLIAAGIIQTRWATVDEWTEESPAVS